MTPVAINETVGTILTTETLQYFIGRQVGVRHIVPNLTEGGVYVIFQQVQHPEKCLKLNDTEWVAHDTTLVAGGHYEIVAQSPCFKCLK